MVENKYKSFAEFVLGKIPNFKMPDRRQTTNQAGPMGMSPVSVVLPAKLNKQILQHPLPNKRPEIGTIQKIKL